jgi:hypothetical protein
VNEETVMSFTPSLTVGLLPRSKEDFSYCAPGAFPPGFDNEVKAARTETACVVVQRLESCVIARHIMFEPSVTGSMEDGNCHFYQSILEYLAEDGWVVVSASYSMKRIELKNFGS